MSERGWKEQPEREASLLAEDRKDSHPCCAIHMETPKGTMVGKILQTRPPEKACSADSIVFLSLVLEQNICLLDEVLDEEF